MLITTIVNAGPILSNKLCTFFISFVSLEGLKSGMKITCGVGLTKYNRERNSQLNYFKGHQQTQKKIPQQPCQFFQYYLLFPDLRIWQLQAVLFTN